MIYQGKCLCSGVSYEIDGELSQPIACHCSQCARTSGNFAAMAACKFKDISLVADGTLSWYRSSEHVMRGFCSACGSNLFWKSVNDDEVYVTMGSLDRPTSLHLSRHIFVGSKSDYYEVTDGLPQKLEW